MAYNSYNNSSNATIELYTLEDAREILREEARQKRLARQKKKQIKLECRLMIL